MNLFEININKKFIFIATDQKVQLIPFDKLNLTFEKPQLFLECGDIINHIRLMKTDKDDEDILLVVDNSGLLYTKKVSVVNKKIEEAQMKLFNCKVNSNDNSIWSVDCHYPFIAIGGNHRCVMVLNYNDEDTSREQSKSILYEGNEHNIPCVSISQCGLFVCSASIDSHVKVFDFNKGNLLLKILNINKEWGWSVKLINKDLFDHVAFNYNASEYQNADNQIINLLGLTNSAKTNKVILSKASNDDDAKESKLSPYERFLQDNLINKYYLLSSSSERVSLYEMCFENSNLIAKSLGKIELLVNCIKEKYKTIANLDVYSVFMIKNMVKYSRYEFIEVVNEMKIVIFGNKNGDIQIYQLAIDIDEVNNKIGIRDQPIIIVDCHERLGGIRIEEKGESSVDIYVLTLSGMLYCYHIAKNE